MKYDVTPIGPTSSIRMITNLPTVDGAIFSFPTLSRLSLCYLQFRELVELGRTDVALDVLAKRGDWDRLWEVAA